MDADATGTGIAPRASRTRARRDSPQRHRLARRYLTARTRGRETNERTNEYATTRHAGSDLRAHRAGWDPNGELVLGTVLSRTRDSTGVRVFFMRVIRRARARAVSIVRLGLGGSERAREIRRD